MKRIFVYEYASGGGLVADPALEADWLPAGLQMRNAVVADLLALPDVTVTCATVGDPATALPPWPGQAAAFALQSVTPRPGMAAATFVGRLAHDHDLAWVIAPETGGVLGRMKAAVGAQRWIGCSTKAIATASSKQATLQALAGRGIATPLAFAHLTGGRWVVKPDDGAGAVAVQVHARHDAALADAAQRRAAGGSVSVEPFVDGETLSISLLVGPGGTQTLSLNRQHIRVTDDGLLRFEGVSIDALDLHRDPRAAALQALAGEVVAAMPGLQGFVGLDLVWHPERGPVMIEVNSRVTCAYVGLSARLRRNLAEEILSWHRVGGAAHG